MVDETHVQVILPRHVHEPLLISLDSLTLGISRLGKAASPSWSNPPDFKLLSVKGA